MLMDQILVAESLPNSKTNHTKDVGNFISGTRGVQRPIKLQVPEYLSTNSFQLLSDQHIFGGAAKLAATPKYLLLYS